MKKSELSEIIKETIKEVLDKGNLKGYYALLNQHLPYKYTNIFIQKFMNYSWKNEGDFEKGVELALDAWDLDIENIKNWEDQDWQNLLDYLDEILTGRLG